MLPLLLHTQFSSLLATNFFLNKRIIKMHLTWFLLLRKFPSWALTLDVNIISLKCIPALLCSAESLHLWYRCPSSATPPPPKMILVLNLIDISTQSLLSIFPPPPPLLGLATGSPIGRLHFKCFSCTLFSSRKWEVNSGSRGQGQMVQYV